MAGAAGGPGMSVHLRRDGRWAVCRRAPGACPLPAHLDDTTPAEAAEMPQEFLEALFTVVDPPTSVYQNFGDTTTTQAWQAHRKNGQLGELHREFGLPAIIRADGARGWYWHGSLHRAHDLPAVILPLTVENSSAFSNIKRGMPRGLAVIDGTREWWRQGVRDRRSGPAVIDERNGYEAWYRRGALHRAGAPAVTYEDGSTEFWVRGRREG